MLPSPQLIPGPVTRPLPVTATVSVACVVTAVLKFAVTVFEVVIWTAHVVAVPVHEPPQPENVAPEFGTSTSVTVVPAANVSEQSVAPLPQLIPAPTTVPFPVALTVSVVAELPPENVAETPSDAFCIVTVHVVVVPEQVPPQPLNVAPLAGVSVSVTAVPGE